MKFSKSLIYTLRDAPADAEVISHILLMRAGMVRKVAAGIYEFLPLGLLSFKKVENIVRKKLNQADCQEVLMPHMVPASLWQESGRWGKYGKELLRIRDRKDNDYCFGPTHEEVICDMVRHVVSSYKSFPLNLYQIQTKFRDEIRPRFGLMRGREFVMKDGYSFHDSYEDLDREYQKMHQTYLNIFKACGLECRAVDADTGAIGGSSSHEFMVLAETGEDVVAYCTACDYAANLEKASHHIDASQVQLSNLKMEDVKTPDLKTIDEVSKYLKIKPSQMIKTLVYVADKKFAIVCLAGNREVNEVKLGHVLQADELRLATDEEILELTGITTGYLGPIVLINKIKNQRPDANCSVIYDRSIIQCGDAVTGANKKDFHTIHVNIERDLSLSISKLDENFNDISNVRQDDVCPKCHKGYLALVRGIEVGHIFKLGTRYSKPMKVRYLDKDGKENDVIMGTYGLGIGRTMAASIEQNHDDKGIIWPRALAPCDVCLITLDPTPEIIETAQKIYEHLKQKNIEVLWDDRDERAGVKFNDADLIGLPLQVILGKRGLEKRQIEYKIRRSGQKGFFPLETAIDEIEKILETL